MHKSGIILFGPGKIGLEFLNKVMHDPNLGLVALVDGSGYFSNNGYLNGAELAGAITHKLNGGKFNGVPLAGIQTIQHNPAYGPYLAAQITLDKIVSGKENIIVVDAADSDHTALALASALIKGIKVVSANKAPFAVPNIGNIFMSSSVNRLYFGVLEGTVINRATVGANLGVPEALLEILSQHPDSLSIRMAPSGTLNFAASYFGGISEGFDAAIHNGYAEPYPYIDASGIDVLRKATILARTIATYLCIPFYQISVSHESFLEKAITLHQSRVQTCDCDFEGLKSSRGDEFVECIRSLDMDFELLGSGGNLRYVADVVLDRGSISIRTGLLSFSPDTYLGSLKGPDNLFQFYVNNVGTPARVIGPGPGAGIGHTAQALYEGVLKHNLK
ncbi:hypothetical protein HYU11_01480 [Candidatus Woesearchaeota archaeon]|nr:hypothetical protein [Candidatus Woesearchaeota archaeon]